jgi:hypothetical protein
MGTQANLGCPPAGVASTPVGLTHRHSCALAPEANASHYMTTTATPNLEAISLILTLPSHP